jgi:hypothetical protein
MIAAKTRMMATWGSAEKHHHGWNRVALALALLSFAVVLTACSTPTPPNGPVFTAIESTFDSDVEGWTSSEPLDPVWAAPGYLSLVDGDGGWYYAIAPAGFHGDWTGANRIDVDALADAAGILYPLRLVVTGGGTTMVHEFALDALEAGEWRTVGVELDAALWTTFVDETNLGPALDATTFAAVLADVTDFRVRIDLNDGFQGDEFNGLDDVKVH